MSTLPKTSHIGIIACSAEGAALCYRAICAEGEKVFGVKHWHPELTMHTHPFSRYVEYLEKGDLQGVSSLMLFSAEICKKAGANLLICPDNTIHIALHLVAPLSPLPFLPINDCVAAEASRRKFKRIGIMGTRWLVDSSLYQDALAKFNIEAIRPSAHDRDRLNKIIMDELVLGVIDPSRVKRLTRIIQHFVEASCDAVILGCTELPLCLTDANSALPTLDQDPGSRGPRSAQGWRRYRHVRRPLRRRRRLRRHFVKKLLFAYLDIDRKVPPGVRPSEVPCCAACRRLLEGQGRIIPL